MFRLKIAIPVLLLFAALPSVSQAQVSIPLRTYHVQVKKEMWRNGNTYWSTVFSTDDYEDALLMEALLESALENGTICQILNCDFDWIIRDVRISVQWNLPLLEMNALSPKIYSNSDLYLRSP